MPGKQIPGFALISNREVYKDAKMGQAKYMRDGNSHTVVSPAIKLEALTAEGEEVLVAKGWFRPGGRGGGGGWGSRSWGGRGGASRGGGGRRGSASSSNVGPKKNENPKDAKGNIIRCPSCESVRHLLADCPDSYENLRKSRSLALAAAPAEKEEEESYFTDTLAGIMRKVGQGGEAEDIILYTGSRKKVTGLSGETLGSLLLDCGCSSNVAGEGWWNSYQASLVPELKKKVQVFPSRGKKFRFGGGKVLTSIKLVKFPGRLAGRDVMFSSHVVQSNIPLLWSRPAMARAGTVLDIPKDRAKILGVWVDLKLTDVGHYALDIMPPDMVVTEQCLATLPADVKEKEATLRKLHRQFGHPRQEVTVGRLRKVNCADKKAKKMVASIHESCATCKRFSPTPPRPVVSLPQASDFGEVLTLDLKEEPQAEEVQPAAGEHGFQAEGRQQEEGHPEQQAEVPGQKDDVPVQQADVPVQRADVPVKQDEVPVQQVELLLLELQLEQEHEERLGFLRERHKMEGRIMSLQDALEHGQDEEQVRKLWRDLRKSMVLLKDAQMLLDKQGSKGMNKLVLRQLKNQVEDSEFARTAAQKARQNCELDLGETQLEDACRAKAKADLEERLVKVSRERAELALQLRQRENKEEMAKLIKKYKASVAAGSTDQRNRAREQLAEAEQRVEHLRGESVSVAAHRREELRVRELESKLELEKTSKGRLKTQVARLEEVVERQGKEGEGLRTKEKAATEEGRKATKQWREAREEVVSLQGREAEWGQKRLELEKQVELGEVDTLSVRNELKLAMRRVEDLQAAIQGEMDSKTDLNDTHNSEEDTADLFLRNRRQLGMSARSSHFSPDPGSTAPLGWGSSKVRLAVASTVAAEALSLQMALSHAVYVRAVLAETLRVDELAISIHSYTDSNNLHQVINYTKFVVNKRLPLDIAQIQECVAEHKVTVRGVKADALLDVITSGFLPQEDKNKKDGEDERRVV